MGEAKGKFDIDYLEDKCRSLGVWKEFVEMKKRVEKYLKEWKNRVK
jgi:hypothetical protein